MDYAVALRGDSFAPIAALSPDAIERAAAADTPAIICLSGNEDADAITAFLASGTTAVFVAPVPPLRAEVEQALDSLGTALFEHATSPLVVIAAVIARVREILLETQSASERSGATGPVRDAGFE